MLNILDRTGSDNVNLSVISHFIFISLVVYFLNIEPVSQSVPSLEPGFLIIYILTLVEYFEVTITISFDYYIMSCDMVSMYCHTGPIHFQKSLCNNRSLGIALGVQHEWISASNIAYMSNLFLRGFRILVLVLSSIQKTFSNDKK